MKIARVSPRTGIENTLDLPITEQQLKRWQSGKELIQNIFPELTPDQREFLITGYTAEDWAILFPPEDDDA